MTYEPAFTVAADSAFAPAYFEPEIEVRREGEPEQPAISEQDKEILFRNLFAEYGHVLRYFILRRVGNETDAAELAQQAFVEAALSLTTFRGEAAISTWIFGIATNLVRNYLSRAPHRRHLFESTDVLEQFESHEPDPSETLEHRETLALVSAAMDALPAHVSEALMLVSVNGASYEEAARQLRVPVGTVRSRVSRARAAIRNKLRDANCGIEY